MEVLIEVNQLQKDCSFKIVYQNTVQISDISQIESLRESLGLLYPRATFVTFKFHV